MTREELIQFLKENLKVKVNKVWSYGIGKTLRVELYLGEELIDWDEEYTD